MRLRELKEKRSRVIKDLRELSDNPSGNAGDLSEEQEKRFTELQTELESVERNISREELVTEAERRMQGEQITGSSDTNWDEQCRSFSLTRAIAAKSGISVDDGREREVSQELERRTGRQFQGVAVPTEIFEKRVVTSGGTGANVIATDHLGNQYIDRIRAKAIVARLGARYLTGLQGNTEIPKLTGSATASWFAENTAITPSDQTFSNVGLTPKHLGCITEFSRNLLVQSSPDIEDLIRDDFAKIIAEQIDYAAIWEGGANGPDGIIGSGLATSIDLTAGPTWAGIQEMVASVTEGGTGWAMSPDVRKDLMSTVRVASTDSRFIMENPNELVSYPVGVSTLADEDSPGTDRSLIFGKWSDLMIGQWGALDILVNPYESTAYSKGNVQVRGIITADIALRHGESFAVAGNVG